MCLSEKKDSMTTKQIMLRGVSEVSAAPPRAMMIKINKHSEEKKSMRRAGRRRDGLRERKRKKVVHFMKWDSVAYVCRYSFREDRDGGRSGVRLSLSGALCARCCMSMICFKRSISRKTDNTGRREAEIVREVWEVCMRKGKRERRCGNHGMKGICNLKIAHLVSTPFPLPLPLQLPLSTPNFQV